MFARQIEPGELNEMPLRSFEGTIHVIESISEAEEAAELLSTYKVLGFDTETKPSFKKGKNNPVALLQLATDHEAWLFRLNRTKGVPGIGRILADPAVVKVGAAIRDDVRPLKELFRIEPAGFIDLQEFVRRFGIENSGLKKLAAIVLGFRISKSQQLSNWDAGSLTEPQMRYAATDAWVCLSIYRKLNEVLANG